jgi:hypothetical protein
MLHPASATETIAFDGLHCKHIVLYNTYLRLPIICSKHPAIMDNANINLSIYI